LRTEHQNFDFESLSIASRSAIFMAARLCSPLVLFNASCIPPKLQRIRTFGFSIPSSDSTDDGEVIPHLTQVSVSKTAPWQNKTNQIHYSFSDSCLNRSLNFPLDKHSGDRTVDASCSLVDHNISQTDVRLNIETAKDILTAVEATHGMNEAIGIDDIESEDSCFMLHDEESDVDEFEE
jgi:hypothetical protein